MTKLSERLPGPAPQPQQGRPLRLKRGGTGGGRPTRAAASGNLAVLSPIPELFTLPARKLYLHLRTVDDVEALRRAHQLEVEHLRRQTVLGWIEERLRSLGAPLGGPLVEPWPGYESLEDQEYVIDRIAELSAQQAADVAAWEHYRHRRRAVVKAAEEIAGPLAAQRIAETAPRRGTDSLPEPFAGYDRLSTSPHARAATRAALSGRTLWELQDAVRYEESMKRRKTMLRELRAIVTLKQQSAAS